MPKGGLARRATAIKRERGLNEGPVLVLDAGNALLGHWISVASAGRVMVEAMNAMSYDAMAVGGLDLAGGLEVLTQRQSEATFAFLSANLVTTGDSQLVVKPYVILERAGVRFGILGLTDPKAVEVVPESDKVTVLDPVQVAHQYLPELRERVDVLIVLSNLGLDGDRALAAAVPGIDIVVGGTTHKLMRDPERVENTLIVQQGYRGEWMGRLRVSYDARGLPVAFSEDLITLTDDFADDREVAALVEKWRAICPTRTPRPTQTPRPKS